MTAGGSINIDVMRWSRLADIYDYAAEHAIPLEQAVEALVNRGLSHTASPAKLDGAQRSSFAASAKPPWQQSSFKPFGI